MAQLTKPIALYMESLNANDAAAIEASIAKDAHVYDMGENNHINGLEAIKKWRGAANEEFNLKSEVRNVEDKYGVTIVKSLTSGNFPGSPQLFYYFFTVVDGLITDILILPGEENSR